MNHLGGDHIALNVSCGGIKQELNHVKTFTREKKWFFKEITLKMNYVTKPYENKWLVFFYNYINESCDKIHRWKLTLKIIAYK